MAGSSSHTIASLVTNSKAGSTTKNPVVKVQLPLIVESSIYQDGLLFVGLQSARSFYLINAPVSSAGPLLPFRIGSKENLVRYGVHDVYPQDHSQMFLLRLHKSSSRRCGGLNGMAMELSAMLRYKRHHFMKGRNQEPNYKGIQKPCRTKSKQSV